MEKTITTLGLVLLSIIGFSQERFPDIKRFCNLSMYPEFDTPEDIAFFNDYVRTQTFTTIGAYYQCHVMYELSRYEEMDKDLLIAALDSIYGYRGYKYSLRVAEVFMFSDNSILRKEARHNVHVKRLLAHICSKDYKELTKEFKERLLPLLNKYLYQGKDTSSYYRTEDTHIPIKLKSYEKITIPTSFDPILTIG